jgi:hypothetical protein
MKFAAGSHSHRLFLILWERLPAARIRSYRCSASVCGIVVYRLRTRTDVDLNHAGTEARPTHHLHQIHQRRAGLRASRNQVGRSIRSSTC